MNAPPPGDTVLYILAGRWQGTTRGQARVNISNAPKTLDSSSKQALSQHEGSFLFYSVSKRQLECNPRVRVFSVSCSRFLALILSPSCSLFTIVQEAAIVREFRPTMEQGYSDRPLGFVGASPRFCIWRAGRGSPCAVHVRVVTPCLVLVTTESRIPGGIAPGEPRAIRLSN